VTFGYQYGTEQAKQLLQACRDAGVNMFDNAEVYAKGEAETIMVCFLKGLLWLVALLRRVCWPCVAVAALYD
jgi:aryl-alcohol dehydrogenase-like predicted oxidoreductase